MNETLGRPAILLRALKTMRRPVRATAQAGRTEGGRTVTLRIKDGSQELTYIIPLSEWQRLDHDARQVP